MCASAPVRFRSLQQRTIEADAGGGRRVPTRRDTTPASAADYQRTTLAGWSGGAKPRESRAAKAGRRWRTGASGALSQHPRLPSVLDGLVTAAQA